MTKTYYDHDQNTQGVAEEVAKTQVVLVNQHEVRAVDQANVQRATKQGPQAGGDRLKQVTQSVCLHLTLANAQVD
jgi:hypothetical protein